jgi:hypothetical protein
MSALEGRADAASKSAARAAGTAGGDRCTAHHQWLQRADRIWAGTRSANSSSIQYIAPTYYLVAIALRRCGLNLALGKADLKQKGQFMFSNWQGVSQERRHPILSQIQIGDAQPGRARAPKLCRLSKELVICQIQCHPTVHACPDETRVAPKSTEHGT